MGETATNIVHLYVEPQPPVARPQPPAEAFAWSDYITDQHRVRGMLVPPTLKPSEASRLRTITIIKAAVALAKAEGVTTTELETLCTEVQLDTSAPARPTTCAAQLMTEMLAYGAVKQVRLDILTKEEIERLEKMPHD